MSDVKKMKRKNLFITKTKENDECPAMTAKY
jgi:hypothetical protein